MLNIFSLILKNNIYDSKDLLMNILRIIINYPKLLNLITTSQLKYYLSYLKRDSNYQFRSKP